MLNDICPSRTAQNISKIFCGNHEAVAELAAMIDSGHLPHAFIVEGDDGLGKSTFARIIAMGAMCTCEQPLSGECPHCRKLRANIHPDLIYVTGSGKLNSISIDSVREVRIDSQIAPNEADRRVFVLEDCDNMLPASQNAFLKIFEEAPPHIIFVITCRCAMNLLTTIRSRGRIITLHPVDVEQGAEFICSARSDIDKKDAESACIKSCGNIGEALRGFGGEGGEFIKAADSLTRGIILAMCSGSELELSEKCSAIGKDRGLADAVCARLCEELRRSVMVSVGAQDTLDSPSAEVMHLGATASADALIKCIEEINTLSDWLKININMPLFNTRLAIILQRR